MLELKNVCVAADGGDEGDVDIINDISLALQE